MSLYHEAAEILLSSGTDGPGAGGSLKSRVFGKKGKSPPGQLYALVLESAKWSGVLTEVIEKADILKLERKLTPALALLLVHDLLLAKGGIALPQSHGLRASVERHKGRLASQLTLARLRRKAPTIEALKEQVERASAGEEANYPRWVRINALKASLEDQLETTFSQYARAESIQQVVAKSGRYIYIDSHVPNLVAVSPGFDLTKTDAYSSGKIILQDKASCFPAYLLDPRSEDGDVIDACSAPGNKTTHLAGILHEHRSEYEGSPQTIYAFEKDSRRAKTLEKMVKIAGSKNATRIGFGQDFLQVDPRADRFRDVGALLLDPSCSGSGIVGRDSMPELHLPDSPTEHQGAARGKQEQGKASKWKRKHDEANGETQNVIVDDDGNETVIKSEKDLEARLEALSAFQLSLLLHAFRFPRARKITYSTCSVHSQENERVVMRALESDLAKTKGWRILRREDQVVGMREWPVRGLVEACSGDREAADGCIRSYKGDGQGVMGFFVAGFVRDDVDVASPPPGTTGAGGDDGDGPYVRDDSGRIMRDMLGMPVLKTTGMPVSLESPHEKDDEEDRSGDDSESEGESSGEGSESDQLAAAEEMAYVSNSRGRPYGVSKLTDEVEDEDEEVEHEAESEWEGVSDS